MPASSTASSLSKTKDNRRISHTPSKQDTDHVESNPESTEAPEEPPTPPQPLPATPFKRRVRPLSETRSFHSIFSSVRGSVRNTGKTVPLRVRSKDREDKEEKQREKISTTPPPVDETTTMEAASETKEPDNNVSPESEDEVGYGEEPLTTETPSLKVLTPSPTKLAFNNANPPPKRPIKIRVHQKPISRVASSSSSSSSPSSSSSFPSTSTSSSSSSHIQESAASRKDYVASTFPQTKNTYDTSSIIHNKPSTPVVKETNSQQTETSPIGRGSALAVRTSGSRYISSRRHPGILLRSHLNRTLNGYKLDITPRSNSPSRTLDQTTSNTHSSAKSQSTLPDGSQNHKTGTSRSTSGSAPNRQATSDAFNLEKSQSTSESRSRGSTTSHILDINPSTTQSGSQQPSSTDKSVSHQSTSHRAFHSSASSHNSHSSQTSYTLLERDTNEDTKNKNTAEEPTSSSKRQTAEEETREEEGKDKSANEKSAVSRTRISPSFVERFPWLKSRYPGLNLGSRITSPRSRNLSSVGASGPNLSETPNRVSGATGAAGVSSIQETSEDVRTASSHDSIKNGVGAGSVKPPLTNQNTASSNDRNPTTSSSSPSSASSSTSTSLSSHRSSSGHTDSSDPIHKGTSNNNNNDRNKDSIGERSTEINGKNDKVTDSRVTQNNPAIIGADPHRNTEDNESVDTDETASRTRSGTSFVVNPNHHHPGLGSNGRTRSSPLANRQIGGSRFSIRPKPAQNPRLDSSKSDSSSSSSSDSLSSSHLPQSVSVTSERDAGTGTTATRTGGFTGSNSRSTSSSTRDSTRSQGGRSRYPFFRGKPTSGGALKPGNGNGKVSW